MINSYSITHLLLGRFLCHQRPRSLVHGAKYAVPEREVQCKVRLQITPLAATHAIKVGQIHSPLNPMTDDARCGSKARSQSGSQRT